MSHDENQSLIQCANESCARLLDIRENTRHPGREVDAGLIHRCVSPSESPASVGCPHCGHYTIRVKRTEMGGFRHADAP